ncbi:stachyose synthase-like [Ananas comosus]|uniref:Stachyose synthase-like n=1 Tax=Ananas comosus TaxID=4615 RepID=A0A6P5FZ42_ANACO|nr:stachyose synthase-like [Ananas comosus]
MAPPPNDPIASVNSTTHSAAPKSGAFSLSEGKLFLNNIPLLSDVPSHVTLSPFSLPHSTNAPPHITDQAQAQAHRGSFLGFRLPHPSHRPETSLGRFACRRFLSTFRFKTWWSTMWVGSRGRDLQPETQWLLLHVPELASYVLILPLIENKFRSALRAGDDDDHDHVVLYAESGSYSIQSNSFRRMAYMHVADDPYELMREAYRAARVQLGTFRLVEEKALPALVDKFGWCTWDAFYLTVDPAGVWHGLKELAEGGVEPRFLIVDDGWQSVNLDGQPPDEDAARRLVLGGEQMTARLHRFDECERFRRYKAGALLRENAPPYDASRPRRIIRKAAEIESVGKARAKAARSGAADLSSFDEKLAALRSELDLMLEGRKSAIDYSGGDGDGECSSDQMGLKAFVKDLRTRFKGLDDVYVWQALCGAWGGVRPGATHLNARVVPAKIPPSLAATMDDLAVDKIVEGGIGLVDPAQAADLYESMHSYLASAGVTGVKVDVTHALEYVCEEYGGRVELAKEYYDGLSKSLVKNFNGTGIISSMQQCNDFFFLGTWQVPMGRAGDDFWYDDPNGDPMGVYWLQGVHMINCSYNSLWMGQFIQPDWDMFQTDHACGAFHGASRAVCGGPVYVSDSLGGHDFHLLKKLVFPDGTVPKCIHYALPTRDCLFENPLFDQKTVLKIWNLNKYGGVIGAFNCQGAGWDAKERRIRGYSHCYKPVDGRVHPTDVEWGQKKETAALGRAQKYALYLHQANRLVLTNISSGPIEFTLEPSAFEIFTFAPIEEVGGGVEFAPIGLVNMFNSGGTLQEVVVHNEEGEEGIRVRVRVKGGGELLVHSSVEPKRGLVEGKEVGFEWKGEGEVRVDVPWNEESHGVSDIVFVY